jgi:SAM-dependent methyltransferase
MIDCDTYNKLYKRFLKRGPGQMLDLAGFKAGDSFLDLCCGTGRASEEAIDRGASRAFAIDKTESKLSCRFALQDFLQEASVIERGPMRFEKYGAREFFYDTEGLADSKFDCIFCQQAINYWLLEKDDIKQTSAELVSRALNPNGKFVFNTFNTKPSEDIAVKEYEIDGVYYAEVSQLVDGVVHHGQFCEGCIPDHQEFDWISPEEFMSLLMPYFKNIHIHEDGPTDIYVCSN